MRRRSSIAAMALAAVLITWLVAAGEIFSTDWASVAKEAKVNYVQFDKDVKDITILQQMTMTSPQGEMSSEMRVFRKGEKFRNFDLKSRTEIMEPSGRGGGHSQTRYPVYENGKWDWSIRLFHLSKDRMDDFKTIFYDLEGWDTETGWPTRSALEGAGIGDVADVLEKQGKPLKD